MKPPRWKLPESLKQIKHWLYIGQIHDVDVWINSNFKPNDNMAKSRNLAGVRVNNKTIYNYVPPEYVAEAKRLVAPYLTPKGNLNQMFWARVKLESTL